MTCTPSFGVRPCSSVTKKMTAHRRALGLGRGVFGQEGGEERAGGRGGAPPSAMPRVTQRSAVCPAETRMLYAEARLRNVRAVCARAGTHFCAKT